MVNQRSVAVERVRKLIRSAKRSDLKAEDDSELRTCLRELSPQDLALYLRLYDYKEGTELERYEWEDLIATSISVGGPLVLMFLLMLIAVVMRMLDVQTLGILLVILWLGGTLCCGSVIFIYRYGIWASRQQRIVHQLFGSEVDTRNADGKSLWRVLSIISDARFLPVMLNFCDCQSGIKGRMECWSAITRCLNNVAPSTELTLEKRHYQRLVQHLKRVRGIEIPIAVIRASRFLSYEPLQRRVASLAESTKGLDTSPLIANRIQEECRKVVSPSEQLPLAYGG